MPQREVFCKRYFSLRYQQFNPPGAAPCKLLNLQGFFLCQRGPQICHRLARF
jgi:hypothetical protein